MSSRAEPVVEWKRPPAGSPWEVSASAPAFLAAYGLEPPVRADAGLCVLMAGLSGTAHRYPCPGGGAYVAVMDEGRAQFPVCSGHAQQLVNLATADRSRPRLLLLPLHNGVGHGIPDEFIGPMFAGAASGPNYRPGGGFRRGW